MIQSMVWPWLAQAARAWGSDTQRVPCRQELPGDSVVIVLVVPPVTVGAAVQVVAAQAGAEVPVEKAAVEATAPVEAAVVRLYHTKKCNRQKGPYKGPFLLETLDLSLPI